MKHYLLQIKKTSLALHSLDTLSYIRIKETSFYYNETAKNYKRFKYYAVLCSIIPLFTLLHFMQVKPLSPNIL